MIKNFLSIQVRASAFAFCLELMLLCINPTIRAEDISRTSFNDFVTKTALVGNGFLGDYYCSNGSNNSVGVLLLGGSEGGMPRGDLMKFFAKNGYPTLSVAYFKEQSLPESLQLIPLEYFEKPIEWLQTNQQSHVKSIVVFGASRGAELALLLASYNPKIKGVIALSPSSVVWNGMPKELPVIPCSSWTLQGKPIPFMPYDSTKNSAPKDMHDIFVSLQQALKEKDMVENASIKVERIQGPMLLASGDNDEIWPAGKMADDICMRLKENGFKYKYENLKYADAGHTLDERWMFGGTLEGNWKARIDFEKRTLALLEELEKATR